MGASIMPPPGQRCIVVDDLRLAFFIGVREHEKQARQEVSITIWTPIDLSGLARLEELRSLRIDFGLGGWRSAFYCIFWAWGSGHWLARVRASRAMASTSSGRFFNQPS